MKTKIEEEAVVANVRYYEVLWTLRNSMIVAQGYRVLARNFLEAWEQIHGPTPAWHDQLCKVDALFSEVEVAPESQASPSQAGERLKALQPLAAHDLPEDELARLLKALREDGFQWQPPRAV